MAPKLYMLHLSPPARSILILEQALGIKLEHVIVDFSKGEHVQPEFLQKNPQHTIPTLEDDDGTVIWESHAIMAYLVAKYGKDDSLYPKDIKKRALVDQRMHFDSGVIFPVIRKFVKPMMLGVSSGISQELRDQAERYYDFIDKFLEGKTWMAGENVTIADFCLITTVTTLNIPMTVNLKYKNLVQWMKRCQALPCYKANELGLKHFKEFLISKMGSLDRVQ